MNWRLFVKSELYCIILYQMFSRCKENRMARATMLIFENRGSIREIARKLNLPYTSLQSRVSGTRESSIVGRPTSLTPFEEQRLAEWAGEMGKHGLHVGRKDIEAKVSK
jgi:hypothetical protein